MSFSYKNKQLSCGEVALRSLAEKHGTPLYVYNLAAIREQVVALQKGLGAMPHLLAYAVKANWNLAVLKMLQGLGCGFDIVSGGEMFRALKVGTPGEKIVFSGV